LSYITLNKNNFFHNLEVCSKQAGDKSKIAIVLKDNAYGHGLIEIASMAKEFGLTKAVVRDIEEAQKIEQFFEQILILADTSNKSLSHTFHITINTLKDIDQLVSGTNIHIKINTGMNRNGIEKNMLEVAINRALEKKLNICGIFTHHKNADEYNEDFKLQCDIFMTIKSQVRNICEKLNLSKIQVHSCNSAALFRTKNFDEDFARIGIAAYGYSENDERLFSPLLKPVLSLYTHKLSTRTLYTNETIGYGGKYQAQKDMIVSTYDIGYADGFRRIPDGMTYNIKQDLRILGRVSMDNISINSDEDEICLFDDVSSLAKLHKTITYEMLTSLKSYIKRKIIE
jgi:alanine racemase